MASQPVTEIGSNRQEMQHFRPSLLPGGKAVLFSRVRLGDHTYDDARVEVQILATKERRVLVEGGCCGIYSPTGHIVSARAGSLLAVPFDHDKLAVTGPPAPVLEGLSMGENTATAH